MSTTETCFCGAVQLAFSIEGDDLVNTVRLLTSLLLFTCMFTYNNKFVCNCLDCRKLTASMFASNFTIRDASLKYVRGQDKIKTFAMTKTIATGNTMTNYFCSVCGSLMYRISSGWPGVAIMRIGQVDDLTLHETTLKPQVETFTRSRVAWCKGAEGAEQYSGNYYAGEKERSKL